MDRSDDVQFVDDDGLAAPADDRVSLDRLMNFDWIIEFERDFTATAEFWKSRLFIRGAGRLAFRRTACIGHAILRRRRG